MLRVLAPVLLLAPCERRGGGGVRATREQCAAYIAAIGAWNDELHAREDAALSTRDTRGAFHFTSRTVFVGEGFDKICPERFTSRQVACMTEQARRHQMDANGCKPEIDLRPADARHTPAECERYVAKVRELVAAAPRGSAVQELERVDFVAEGAKTECAGWLSRSRYECVLAATTDDARRACPL